MIKRSNLSGGGASQKVVAALTLIFTLGCGSNITAKDDSASTSATPWPSYSVSTTASLPTCDATTAGRLYYIEDEEVFKTCKSGAWETINVGSRVQSRKECNKVSGGLLFGFSASYLSNSDVNVSCRVADAFQTVVGVDFHSGDTVAGALARCLVGYDVDTNSAGLWSFQATSTGATATYSDSGSASNNAVVTFGTADCAVYSY